MKTYFDIPFKKAAGHDLCVDFYIPDDTENPPIIMWIHGGGWNDLNRKWMLVLPQLKNGYAVCSVDYRYADEDIFPAQMIDLKDALRFVKENGKTYGYDSTKVIVSGDSAGGHLCALLGVSNGNKDWESTEADYSVQAVVDFCGPTDLSSNFGRHAGVNEAEDRVLGAGVTTKAGRGRAAAANPCTYVDGTEPPFLILHGSADPAVSPEHSRKLRNALESVNVPVHMYYVPGGEHGLSGELVDKIIREFLDYYIKGIRTVITPQLDSSHDRTVPYAKNNSNLRT